VGGDDLSYYWQLVKKAKFSVISIEANKLFFPFSLTLFLKFNIKISDPLPGFQEQTYSLF